MVTTFREKLRAAQGAHHSWLCVGLDPVMSRLPEAVRSAERPLVAFGRTIVENTAGLVCAYKPNLAFWLAEGADGVRALRQVLEMIPDHLPIILDAKFNDVGHTAQAYARAAFETLGVDAVTLNPYLGLDNVRPFFRKTTICPQRRDTCCSRRCCVRQGRPACRFDGRPNTRLPEA
ncbi:MAG: orotidine-5'-phosphate decarboxylase [Anaerolineae bacterium]|jgi:orotidine 5'-phosphate decarboxylase subfamily 2